MRVFDPLRFGHFWLRKTWRIAPCGKMRRSCTCGVIDTFANVQCQFRPERAAGFYHAVNGAQRQCLNGRVAAFGCQTGHHDNRHRSSTHQTGQKFEPAHPGHFNIEGQNIDGSCAQLIARLDRITGFCNDVQARISFQYGPQPRPHYPGIVDDHHSFGNDVPVR